MASFKMFAGTDVGLRDNNEDNFIVCPDLTKDEWMVPANQQEPIQLGQRGCLFVVADGMGGMNAGEVASDIAIKTVQQLFAPSVLPANIIEKPDSIKAYIKKVITEADQQVKKRSKSDSSAEGMGSTIVIAWLVENNLYIGWLGDSRAYSYSSSKGIERLSKDHSYVQQLVDARMLTEEEAMNHPESNVVIRSLGDTSQKPKPDIVMHTVSDNEIILLCSDGLCGVCTDAEIANVIKQQTNDLQVCKETLTNLALEAGGSDNITIALLQVINTEGCKGNRTSLPRTRFGLWVFYSLAAVCIAIVFFFLWGCPEKRDRLDIEGITLKLDSDTIVFGDTISYNVAVMPLNSIQSYLIECNSPYVLIDTTYSKLSLTKNVSGKAQLVVISQCDSLKRDTATLILYNKSEQISINDAVQQEEKVVVSFKLAHSGPLEAGKEYGYFVSIKPDIIEKGGYNIICSNMSVITINENKRILSVSNDIGNTKKCTITIIPKLKPSNAKKYDIILKSNEIVDEVTPSVEDNPSITTQQNK